MNKPKVHKECKHKGVEVIGSWLVRVLFRWSYQRATKITWFDEDGLPTFIVSKLK